MEQRKNNQDDENLKLGRDWEAMKRKEYEDAYAEEHGGRRRPRKKQFGPGSKFTLPKKKRKK